MHRSLRNRFNFMQGNALVLTITRVMGMFCRGMVFPYASLYILELGGEPAQIGFINSLRPLAGLVAFPIAGYLTDRTGRVRLIALTGFYSGLILLLYVLAPSWHFVALAGLLQGITVLSFPATSAIIADSLSPENRAVGMATMNSMAGALATVAPYAAGAIINAFGVGMGMRVLYASLMVASLASAAINGRFLRETSRRTVERVRLSDLPHILRDAYSGIPSTLSRLPGSLTILAVVIILGFISNSIAGPFWVVFASQEIGLSSVQWGFILFIETGLRNLTYIPAGLVVDRLGRSRCIRASLLASTIAVPLFVLAQTSLHVLLIRSAVGLTNAFFLPACSALMADMIPRDIRGRVMAALGRGTTLIGSTGGGIGGPGVGFLITIPIMIASIAGGYLYAANPISPWLFALATSLVSLLLATFFLHDPAKAEV
jgi:MFS family permease